MDDLFCVRHVPTAKIQDLKLPSVYAYRTWKPSAFDAFPPGMKKLPTFPLCWARHLGQRRSPFRVLLIQCAGELVHYSMIRPIAWRLPLRRPPFSRKGDLELCYLWTDPRHRNRGLSTFACSLLLEIARTSGARSVWYNVQVDNAPSLAVAAKLGFVPIFRCTNKQALSLYTYYADFDFLMPQTKEMAV